MRRYRPPPGLSGQRLRSDWAQIAAVTGELRRRLTLLRRRHNERHTLQWAALRRAEAWLTSPVPSKAAWVLFDVLDALDESGEDTEARDEAGAFLACDIARELGWSRPTDGRFALSGNQ
jgi:hypothetical protein